MAMLIVATVIAVQTGIVKNMTRCSWLGAEGGVWIQQLKDNPRKENLLDVVHATMEQDVREGILTLQMKIRRMEYQQKLTME
jgi:hypothetical protein